MHPEGATMPTSTSEAIASVGLPLDASSFTERVEASQGIHMSTGAVMPAGLSSEQIRMVQRTLTEKGYTTETTGTLDDRTRSSLSDFQRENSLPVTGALDDRTAQALGIDVSQVRPVRGPEER